MADLTEEERLRRVIIICVSCARNLIYYRSIYNGTFASLLDSSRSDVNFWRISNSNFLDIAVLEWCKLFVDKSKNHTRLEILSNEFWKSFLENLNLTHDDFQNYAESVKFYRDKFIAHLDQERKMSIPNLDIMLSSVKFLHYHVCNKYDYKFERLCNNQDEFEKGCELTLQEANFIFQRAL